MRKTIVYIAMSVDGYIADVVGGVSWLGGEAQDHPGDQGYGALMARIDTIVMGMRTYRQIVTELSPGCWVYPGKRTYVVTRSPLRGEPEVAFTSESPAALIDRLKEEPGGDIWICGGAQIVRALAAANRVDEYQLSVIPVLLGGGVRLFGGEMPALPLHLAQVNEENGIVRATYVRR